MLFGRDKEQTEIDRLLDEALADGSGALHISGEPGVGKSALLEYAAQRGAESLRVLRVTGIESEAELPYAALQLLLRPALDRIGVLPEPQANALRGALGLASGSGPDRFLIGLATLTLLDDLAGAEPLLCLIDDAQWLDQASADALLFATRRLQAEGIAMVFASRPGFAAPGLPHMRLGDLDRAAATRVLDEHAPQLTGLARDRVLAEASGNALALLELPGSTADPLSMAMLPLPHRIQEAYQQRISELPRPTQTLLTIAAAEHTGDLDVVLRAAAKMGVPDSALRAAEAAGLVDITTPAVAFRHPLIRAASYQRATFAERQVVHHCLAGVLDGEQEVDRRAWHLAAAATGLDEEVAAALESAADRARERMGFGAAAAALARAARLTPDTGHRARRLVAAAETAELAGQTALAGTLADQADRLAADPRLRAGLASLRARIAFHSGSLRTAYTVLVRAAEDIALLDAGAAAMMLADAARAAFYAGEPAWAEEAHARLLGLPVADDHPAHTVSGAMRLIAGSPEEALPMLHATVSRARGTAPLPAGIRNLAASQAVLAGDFDAAREISWALTETCRTEGMIGWMPLALATLSVADLHLGRFRESAAAAAEGLRVAEDTGQTHRLAHHQGVLAWLAAVEGDEQRCRSLAELNLAHFAADHVATSAAWGVWALAVLDLGFGRWEAVLDRLDSAARGPIGHQISAVYFAPDQVEAAVRLGRPERAAPAFERFRRWAEAARLPWADAVLRRCQALLTEGHEAEEHFLAALKSADRPFERARTELLYGEWLRRARQKTEARTRLRAALETFERLGATPWADHTRAELRAAGENSAPAAPATDLTAKLTPQELQVVRLAATGATNKDIGAQMFLSPKTVGHHLYRAFPKLGVATRIELARLDLG